MAPSRSPSPSKEASKRSSKNSNAGVNKKKPKKAKTRRVKPRPYRPREIPHDRSGYLSIGVVLLQLAGIGDRYGLASRYPDVRDIVERRHVVGPYEISQDTCAFKVPGRLKPVRVQADTLDYQRQGSGARWLTVGTRPKLVIEHFLKKKMCPNLRNDFTIYGKIGSGTFGYVLAARENVELEPGEKPEHFAIKVELATPWSEAQGYTRIPTGPYQEVLPANPNEKNLVKYLPAEAIVMQHLTDCDRFPKLDSVWMHEGIQATVMSASAIHPKWARAREKLPEQLDPNQFYEFPSCTGTYLVYRQKPLLTEIQVCKVATHLLQAIMYLMDMNMVHDDLSPRNYIVDEYLNAKLLDLGQAIMGLEESDFHSNVWTHIEAFEYLIPPEVAKELNKYPREFDLKTVGPRAGQLLGREVKRVECSHDLRQEMLWKFGVLVYLLLHGYAPWERPSYDGRIGAVVEDYATDKTKVWGQAMRRQRILNEELPVREDLSQDCVDVIRFMLAKKVEDRPRSVVELSGMPWFQGHYVDYPPETFERPELPRFERANRQHVYLSDSSG